MRIAVLLLVLLSGCASNPNAIREAWLPQDQHWNQAVIEGAKLPYRDGRQPSYIPPATVLNIVTAREKMEKTSGVRADLAIVDTEAPNAFAFYHEGRPVIALSVSYLKQLGEDQDAIAATIGHELAHLHLGHRGDARAQREQAVTAGQAAGILMNAAVPFSGTLTSLAATAYARSFTRDEERDADKQGLKWAVAAGYDACGHARVVGAFPPNVPLLSTHPGYEERAGLASEYALKATGKPCL